MTQNFFATYTESIVDLYKDTQEGLIEATKKPKRKVYTSINKMLEESFFLGATRFGENFIC